MKINVSPLAEYCINHLNNQILFESSSINSVLRGLSDELDFEARALLPFIRRVHTDLNMPANLPFVKLNQSDSLDSLMDKAPLENGRPTYSIYILLVGEAGLCMMLAGVRTLSALAKNQAVSTSKVAAIFTSQLSDDLFDIVSPDDLKPTNGPKQDWSEPVSRVFTVYYEELIASPDGMRVIERLTNGMIGDIKHIYAAAIHKDNLRQEPEEKLPQKSIGQIIFDRLIPILRKAIIQTAADVNGRIKQLIDAGAYRRIQPLIDRSRALSVLNKSLTITQDYPTNDIGSMPAGPRRQILQLREAYLQRLMDLALNSAKSYIEDSPRDIPWIPLRDRGDSYHALMDNLQKRNPAAISMVLFFIKQALASGDWFND